MTQRPRIVDRLSFRILVPISLLIALIGIILYVIIFKLSADFITNLHRENLEWLARSIYGTAAHDLGDLRKEGKFHMRAEREVAAYRAASLEKIGDILRRYGVDGVVTERGQVIFASSGIYTDPKTIIRENPAANVVAYHGQEGKGYYIFQFPFEPMTWHIYLVKDADRLSTLLDRVRTTYLLTGIALAVFLVLLIYYTDRTFRRPLNCIIEAVERGEKPAYRGIHEFTFLGATISRMIDSLRESEERYRLLFREMHSGFALLDIGNRAGESRFLEANPAYEKLAGLSAAELVQRNICPLGPGGAVNWSDVYDNVLRSGEPVHFESYAADHDRHFAVTAFIPQPGKLATLFSDITQYRRAENSLRETNRTLHALIQASPIAIIVCDTNGEIEIWNPSAATLFGWEADEVLGRPNPIVPDERREEERVVLDSVIQGESFAGVELRRRKKDGSIIDVSVSAAPLHAIKGAIVETTGGIFLIEDISHHLQHTREMEAIVNVGAALRAAHDWQDIPPIILDQLLEILTVDGIALALRDNATGETIVEAARGSWSHWQGEGMRDNEGLTGLVLATGKSYLSNDMASDELFAHPRLASDLTCGGCVPLIAHGKTIGALWIGRTSDITEDELRLLSAVGNIAASAIHRSTLQKQTELRMERLTALHAIDMAITTSMNLDVTLDVLLREIVSQLKLDAASILLVNRHSRQLEYAAARGVTLPGQTQRCLRLGEGDAGVAAAQGRSVFIPDLRVGTEQRHRSDEFLAEGFVSYCAFPLLVKGEANGVLELLHRSPLSPDQEWLDFLKALAVQAAIAIDNANLLSDLQRSNLELSQAYDATIEGWSHFLDLRDKETEGHSLRVSDITVALAREMGMTETELVHVRRGALLHDIGKMGIPDSILLKPGSLNDAEREIMRRHPVYAMEMLSPIQYLRPTLVIPYCHHEKWDGTGYPRGLKGNEIPLEARIFTVVDVWDALLSDRPYRKAWPREEVRQHLHDLAGSHFDPLVVQKFLALHQ
ncbi:MAG TPA: HD domain-containing phosphohydrolase [Geobacteraceae bacterium]